MLKAIFDGLERPCDKFEHYFPLYERHFGPFVGRGPKILEIGVQYGGSAEMWRKYFGEGTLIHGVDIAPQCEETDYLKIFIGDQGDPGFWQRTFGDRRDYYDIVIDDGSHDNPDQIVAMQCCYPLIRDGGVFWCEDTHTSYYFEARVRDGGYRNPKSFTEYAKNAIDVLNCEHAKFGIGVGPLGGPRVSPVLSAHYDRIQGVHFYDSVVVIDKGPRFPFKRIIHQPSRS